MLAVILVFFMEHSSHHLHILNVTWYLFGTYHQKCLEHNFSNTTFISNIEIQ